ncbi:MAG: amino acid--tRNA ligase-related protein [Patescibacteria group bacterium]
MQNESRGVFLSKRPAIIDLIRKRGKMISSMRAYLEQRGIIEVETPLLCTHREGGPFAQFETEHPITSKKYFLSMCPEDRLKRICSFFEDGVFEFARCFRAEVDSESHLSEFTMLEIKQPNKTIQDQIELAFGLIQNTVLGVFGQLSTGNYDFRELKTITCYEALKDSVGLDIFDKDITEKALRLLDKAGVKIKNRASEWEVMDNLVKYFVEPQIQELSFLTELPLSLSTISRINHEKGVANRFQIMFNGIEIGDGGEKIIDPNAYRTLYEANSRYRRESLGITEHNEVCEEFFADMAIASPIAGFGIGVDRFVALLLGASIHEVALFPKAYNCC